MGYELNRLLQQYGVSSPVMSAAPSMPSAPVAPTALTANATNDDKSVYNKALSDYNAQKSAYDTALPDLQAKYNVDKTAYDTYAKEYQDRLENTPMYSAAQFQTQPSAGMQYATQPGQIGADRYNQNIRDWFTNNPTATPSDLAVEMNKYGISGYDVASARNGSMWRDALKAPVYSNYLYYIPPIAPAYSVDESSTSNRSNRDFGGVNGGDNVGGNDGMSAGMDGASEGSAGSTAATADSPDGPDGNNGGQGFGGNDGDFGGGFNSDGSIGSDSSGFGGSLGGGFGGEGGFGPGMGGGFDGSDGFGADGFGDGNWACGGLVKKYKIKFADGGLNDMTTNYGRRSGAVSPGLGGLDLSRVSPEQLEFIMQQDPEAVQRGVDRFTELTGIPQTIPETTKTLDPTELSLMFSRYANQDDDTSYREELKAARQQANIETQAFNDIIAKAMNQTAEGPSKAELYFKLAAAFGSPTKTGTFGESLVNASGVMGEHAKATREARQADAANKLKLGLTSQQARMEAAKTDLTNLRQLAGEEMKDNRAMATELVKQQIAAGKPQSEAGKIAVDQGLQPGTQEYNQFVKNYVDDKLQNGTLFKEAMQHIAQQGLELRQQSEARAAAAAKKLTPSEVKLKTETEDAVSATGNVINDLREAYRLNPNTFDNSLPDLAMRKSLEAIGSTDQKVVNSRVQENLLTGQALAGLRAAFGGNPTEGERAILLQVQGIGAKSREERAAIIKRAYILAKAAHERQKKRLEDIKAGAYRETTSVQTPEGIE